MSKTEESAGEAAQFLRVERDRLNTIIRATKALETASRNINLAKDLAAEAGEIWIGTEVEKAQEAISSMIGDFFAARKRKTHAELDELMRQKTNSERR